MKILLLQVVDDVRDRVRFALESGYGAEIEEASATRDALHLLADESVFYDLIIYDIQNDSPEEFRRLLAANQNTPLIVCVKNRQGREHLLDVNIVGSVERGTLLSELNDLLDGMIEKGALPAPALDDEYCRIRTKLLLSVCPLKADIYIRLSPTKHVKLFQTGDVFDLADMEKYTVKKGVEYLYLKREHAREFLDKYTAEVRKLLAAPALTLEAAGKNSETAIEAIQELGKRLGFTKEVQELAKTQVMLSVKSVGRSPRLADMLNKIKNSKGEYVASHSMTCAYLSCAIASQMQWGSEITFFKLNLAAFLHDVTLTNQELAAIGDLAALEAHKGRFTTAEIAEYRAHPQKAAEIVRTFTEVPPDVDTIILQHHETPEGTGFPRKLAGSYIAPLTAVFILAHEMTRYMMEKGPYFDLGEFLGLAKEKYKMGQFRKVLVAMESL